jgi:hypothetical protein
VISVAHNPSDLLYDMEPDIGDRLRSEALKHPLVSIQGFSPPMSCTRGRLVKEPVSPAPAPEPPFPAPVPTPDTNKRLRNRNTLQLMFKKYQNSAKN